MSISWLLYAMLLGVLVTCAAHAVEALLRLVRQPARFVWVLALATSLGLPVLLPLLPSAVPGSVSFLPTSFSLQLPPMMATETVPFWTTTRIITVSWIAVSLGLVVVGIILQRRLLRARCRWRNDQIDDTEVLVSDATGPAVVGVFRPRIVLPDWALSLDEEERRLVLLHEAEHIRAHDPKLLLFGVLTAVAAPWNFPMWYQLARLRRAVEVDCDGRMLRRGVAVRPYASLLLDVGERVSMRAFPVAAFAEQKSLLETRIRAMTARVPRYRIARTMGWGAAAIALVVIACETPIPGEPIPQRSVDPADAAVSEQGVQGPVFTPYTDAPILANAAAVAHTMKQHYPPLLRDAGVGGTVALWVNIDATGAVSQARVKTSSGHPALDDAAVKVIQVAKFAPARNRGTPVVVWVEIPLRFTTGDSEKKELSDAKAELSKVPVTPFPTPAELAARGTGDPEFTPYTTAPALTNQAEVIDAVARNYPPLLRDAGVGGSVELWALIDEDGNVIATRLKKGSGHIGLDEGAMRVAESMKFTKPLNRGTPVKVWVVIPIAFKTN